MSTFKAGFKLNPQIKKNMKNYILIKGARENNLKNIDIKIPRNQFIVITGVSGSGKSSLAFNTIYAEGQRRYVESLSAYGVTHSILSAQHENILNDVTSYYILLKN